MSQYPNNFNAQAFFGQSQSAPALNGNANANGTASPNPNMNTPSPMMGSIRPSALQNFNNSPVASPTPNRPLQFNSSQLASLTDFHQRQQALLAVQQAQAQARAQGQNVNVPVGQGQPRPNLQAMQQILHQRLQAQQQQNALQNFLQNANQNQTQNQVITPAQLQAQAQAQIQAQTQTPPLPLGHLVPSTISPQAKPNPTPPKPLTQNPAFNPALLNAAKIAQNTLNISNPSFSLNLSQTLPSGSSAQQSNNIPTKPANIPLTQTFVPPPDAIRPPSPVKTDTKAADKMDKADGGEKKDEKEKEKKKRPKKKKEKKEDEKDKEKADDKEKGKDKDDDKDSNAPTPSAEKPVKPKKPRTEEEKARRAEARRKKIAADREKAAAAAAAAKTNGEGDEGVFSAAPTANDATPSGEGTNGTKVGEEKDAKEPELKPIEPKAVLATPAVAPETRSRRQEGMRGSMRNEIARLMYGAGDVPEPDIDTVDYMEDMVTEFLADLCRPIPPLRPTLTSQPLPVPLSFDVIRHRLKTPAYGKYLERFDHMVYMSEILKQHRRIANPNLNDLVETVGNDYLGLDDPSANPNGLKRSGEGDEEGRTKKRGRPNSQKVLKDKSEKRKPGPQKGWKLNRDPNAPSLKRLIPGMGAIGQKRKYIRKITTPGAGGGVKREGSINI
ncbi:uncharacterized protein I206_103937 [Kwoniella pini CBS 10737]|uniref:Transcription initiation factor TFIID subunit 13 n=1 Tax=Kwoniella pini CBS 10737 TaxID=1296096 RepID=A0A1B9I342_9TREE|nr:uncharacterized protein I206_04490 [Kwoniella pini CBS 10737]OCF49959.1 hypothetical protein I206_04490 [Kwoniella pini CBS 10737]